ncbi:MAG: alpha-2-macroglobulin family protein [Vulcanimicrobiota bacterium]
MARTSILAAGFLAAWLAGGCTTPSQPGPQPTSQAQVSPVERPPEGLRFKLGRETGQADPVTVPQASATPLSPAELQPLLGALPPLPKATPGPTRAKNPGKPPASGQKLESRFPMSDSPEKPPVVPPGPLQILSCTPQGRVEMAPQLQITFNQPMQALGGPEAPAEIPVRLNPQPAGRWRWLGTQTLVFQPDRRFPMASHFEVEVPADTASLSGAKLKESQHFSFDTPTLQLTDSSPQGPGQGLQPLLYLEFNQDIESDKVAPLLKLSSNREEVPVRQASREQILKDPDMQTRVERAGGRRSLVMVPTQKLEPGQAYSLELPAGLPSAEGPLGTPKAQSFGFNTYEPLQPQVSELQCEPGQELNLAFNNRLDPKLFEPEWVRVQPGVAGLKVTCDDGGLTLNGGFKGHTDYELSLAPAITDEFGQKLGRQEKVQLKVGEARPAFLGPGSRLITLDPTGPPCLRFQVTNYSSLRLRAWKVRPVDWAAFVRYLDDPEHLSPPGQTILDQQLPTRARPDESTPLRLDLKPVFPKNLGQAVVMVEPQLESEQKPPRFVAWVQSTRLGLDACADDNQLVAWVSHLDSGAAWPGAEVELLGSGSLAQAAQDGLAVLLPKTSGTLLVARQGDDLAILPKDFNGWNSGAWNFQQAGDTSLWHVVDDRRLYRPGESVQIKGWWRRQLHGPNGDLQAAPTSLLNYILEDSEGQKISAGKVRSGGLGGFNLELRLPRSMALGECRLVLSASDGSTCQHGFRVEEFRRPEFEVSARAEPGVCQIGQAVQLSTRAAYFSGGPLANAKVEWRVHSAPTSFSPPGWEDYSFGSWKPWWGYAGAFGPGRGEVPDNSTEQSFSSDSKGESRLKVDLLSVEPPQPHSLEAEATVQDLNRQTWTASTSVLVHPASVYVGLKSETTFLQKGQPARTSVLVSDLDGKPVAGRQVKLRFYRQQWDEQGQTQATDLQEKELTSGAGPQSLEWPTGEGGLYVLEARVQDSQNRANASDLSLWVAGEKPPPPTRMTQQEVVLIPGKRLYQVGETAEVMARAPFAPAELLVTTRRDGLVHTQRLSAPEGEATLRIPLRELDIPGLEVQVDALGQLAYASGSLSLDISSAPRRLKVAVQPGRAALQPGQSTQVEVQLKDEHDQPVSGLVTLLAVDEAVLALTGYDPADPLESFCVRREAGVDDQHSREFLELSTESQDGANFPQYSSDDGLVDYEASTGSTAGGRAAQPEPALSPPPPPPPPKAFQLRSNFTPLAAFQPDVATDTNGRAKITVTVPDNLTRYRLIALAESGVKRFGKGESSLTARKPLQLRPAGPRFANRGDRFQLPVIVQNQSDQTMQVDLVCRTDLLKLENGASQAGYRLQLNAQERAEVRFVCASQQTGTARVQWAANAVAANDAVEISLPVWSPASARTEASYGVLEHGGLHQKIERPAQADPEYGQFSLTTSSSALAELTDSYLYLRDYPYECSEQLASRVLSTAALRDLLSAFEAAQPETPQQIQASLEKDVKHLQALQNEDGGFDFWERDRPSDPYLSVHVAHMLVRLKQKGYRLGEPLWERSAAYLKNIQSVLASPEYSPECRRAIRAYALYVLELSGRPDLAGAKALLNECPLPEQGPEVLAWLLPTLAKEPASAGKVLAYLDNHSNQTAASAEFSFNYSDKGYLLLYSDRRDDALILESLVRVKPDHPLIPKLVRGLLDHRRQGRWENTQENCWVLLAMDAYFQKYEKSPPDFIARYWLGDQWAGQQTFSGRERQPKQVRLPVADLPDQGELVMTKQGPGRLYYRLGLDWTPLQPEAAALDHGFALERTYQALEDNRDVSRDGRGVWHIKAGSLVRVNLSMQTPARRYQVALVDPLPAGLEAVNPELAGSPPTPPGNRQDGWWSSYWFDHQNLRDERVEAFTSLLREGVYRYSYLARATTLGEFVDPPTRAEEMYHPETFGRCASEKVVVE